MPKRKETMTDQREDAAPELGGAAVGAAAGGAIGAAAGGPIGAVAGAAVGGTAGALAGKAAERVVEYDEDEFRTMWESGGYQDQYTWDRAFPAYRYGWQARDRHAIEADDFEAARANLKSHWRGPGPFDEAEPMIRDAWERRLQARIDSGGAAVVPVVEEEVKVGKRKVSRGGVRVEQTVTETPVAEDVHLHEEHVEVERRPANRRATRADALEAFQEGEIELEETAEEVVVAKDARVVEEVVVRKKGSDRTETVRDTVRRTDVAVEKVDGDFDDTAYRADFQARYASTGASYDAYAPAYRLGHSLAADARYRSADWAKLEPRARRRWEQEHEEGTWEQVKDAVRHAWDRVTGTA